MNKLQKEIKKKRFANRNFINYVYCMLEKQGKKRNAVSMAKIPEEQYLYLVNAAREDRRTIAGQVASIVDQWIARREDVCMREARAVAMRVNRQRKNEKDEYEDAEILARTRANV